MSRSDGREEARSNGESSGPARFQAFRSTVKALDAQEVDRQLPNLVKTVVDKSTDPETEMFVIGISFSKSETLLDYRLERLVDDGEIGQSRLETLKPAVSGTHLYLTFPYPPDSHFTADALRGAILTTIEKQVSSRSGGDPGSQKEGSSERSSRLTDLLRQIGLV